MTFFVYIIRVSSSASLPAAPRRVIVSPAMAAPLPPHAASFSPAAPRTAAEAIAVDLDRAEVGRPRACDREQTNVSTGEVVFFTGGLHPSSRQRHGCSAEAATAPSPGSEPAPSHPCHRPHAVLSNAVAATRRALVGGGDADEAFAAPRGGEAAGRLRGLPLEADVVTVSLIEPTGEVSPFTSGVDRGTPPIAAPETSPTRAADEDNEADEGDDPSRRRRGETEEEEEKAENEECSEERGKHLNAAADADAVGRKASGSGTGPSVDSAGRERSPSVALDGSTHSYFASLFASLPDPGVLLENTAPMHLLPYDGRAAPRREDARRASDVERGLSRVDLPASPIEALAFTARNRLVEMKKQAKAEAMRRKLRRLLEAGVSLAEAFPEGPPRAVAPAASLTKPLRLSFIFPGGSLSTVAPPRKRYRDGESPSSSDDERSDMSDDADEPDEEAGEEGEVSEGEKESLRANSGAKPRMLHATGVGSSLRESLREPSANDSREPRALPFQVGSVVIVNLGRVIPEVSGRASSSSSYVLPVGFVSRRQYSSVLNPERRVWYESRVEAVPRMAAPAGVVGTAHRSPLNGQNRSLASPGQRKTANQVCVVRVFDCENPEISFSGPSPTHAWQQVIQAVNNVARTRKRAAVSGPQFLGLSSPIVAAEIAKLPGYDECREMMNIAANAR